METIDLDNINYAIFQSRNVGKIKFIKLLEILEEFEVYEDFGKYKDMKAEKLNENIIFLGKSEYNIEISDKIFKYFSKEKIKDTICMKCACVGHAQWITEALKELCPSILGIQNITLHIIREENIRILYIILADEI